VIESDCDSKSQLQGTLVGTIPISLGSLDSSLLNLSPVGLTGTLPPQLLRSSTLTINGVAFSPAFDALNIPAIPCKCKMKLVMVEQRG
jgi:hypothetical protein